MSRWIIVSALLLALLVPLSFAGACEDACNADHAKWAGISQAQYGAKSYYCGVTETNCWSREGTPAGQPDPCWNMCYETPFDNEGFQACCLESARINNDNSLASCLANCVPEQPPASNASVTYNVEVTSSGTVSITDLSGNPVSKLGNYPVSIKTGSSGNVFLVFKTPAGEKSVQLHLSPDSDFRIDTSSCPISYSQSGSFSGPPGAMASLSSEHSCIRGTINGGGDFIKGPANWRASLSGADNTARLDIAPPPDQYGKVDVNESAGPGGQAFELTVSMPEGNIYVNSTNGYAAYSAEPTQGGVKITVTSGSVYVYSSRLPGSRTTVSAGESAFMKPLNITAVKLIPPIECIESSECPGTEVCLNERCVKPSCSSAFMLIAIALGAAFFSARKERVKP